MPRPYDSTDEYSAGSKRPNAVGSVKLFQLKFDMEMTDEQMRELAEEAIRVRNLFLDWDVFYRELDQRKKRNSGFRAAVLALDLQQAAVAMGTTPDKIKMVMESYAATEEARLIELQELWDAGTLPDRDVLGDPSQELDYGE